MKTLLRLSFAILLILCLWIALGPSPAAAQCLTPIIFWEGDHNLPNQFSDPNVNNEDPDGDGVPNLLEFAFNLDPNTPDHHLVTPGTGTNGLPLISYTPGNPTNLFTVEYIRDANALASGVSYRLETAAALTGPWILATNGESATSIPGGTYQHVTAGVQALPPLGSQQFCRLAVVAQPTYCPASIYQIKQGIVPVGNAVRISNTIITGIAPDGFYLQVKETDPIYFGPDYSGIFVHTGTNSPWLTNLSASFRVTVDAIVTSAGSRTILDQVGAVTLISVFLEAPPAPTSVSAGNIISGGPRSYTLESVIVQLGTTETVTAVSPGQFSITDGANPTLVDESLYTVTPTPTVNQTFSTVTGIYSVPNSSPRLQPRSATDLVP